MAWGWVDAWAVCVTGDRDWERPGGATGQTAFVGPIFFAPERA